MPVFDTIVTVIASLPGWAAQVKPPSVSVKLPCSCASATATSTAESEDPRMPIAAAESAAMLDAGQGDTSDAQPSLGCASHVWPVARTTVSNASVTHSAGVLATTLIRFAIGLISTTPWFSRTSMSCPAAMPAATSACSCAAR